MIITPTNKQTAKKNYIEAKENWLKNKTDKNWENFCNKKRICMLLGVKI